jgi:type II secretory pathway pseudopilin PulG
MKTKKSSSPKIQHLALSAQHSAPNSGFTLVEAVVAISILIIGILAIMQLFPQGMRVGRISKQMSVANNLAQAKMEEELAKHYDDIGVGIIEPKAKVDSNPSSQFYIYERQTEVDLVDADLNDSSQNIGLKKITVSIWWQEKEQEKNITLQRLLTKR